MSKKLGMKNITIIHNCLWCPLKLFLFIPHSLHAVFYSPYSVRLNDRGSVLGGIKQGRRKQENKTMKG